MRPFLVCIHDASPAFAVQVGRMVRDLAPLVGTRISLAVVPNWHGAWPLTASPEFCDLIRSSAHEILLHGYTHTRKNGFGVVSAMTARSDEMSGLDLEGALRTVDAGQRMLRTALGEPAEGFLAPAWQQGALRPRDLEGPTKYILGHFAVESRDGRRVSLTTWSWHCGRWSWLGHIGHAFGRAQHMLGLGVPSLALHPIDLEPGFWSRILGLVRELLAAGYEPDSARRIVEGVDAQESL